LIEEMITKAKAAPINRLTISHKTTTEKMVPACGAAVLLASVPPRRCYGWSVALLEGWLATDQLALPAYHGSMVLCKLATSRSTLLGKRLPLRIQELVEPQ
jgi:hypothetical protein